MPVSTSLRAAMGRAPGKVILLGEHAVVAGRSALALPWPAVEAIAFATPAGGDLVLSSDRPGADLEGLRAAAAATLTACGRPAAGLAVHLASTVPAGSGLGSSAATAVAVVRAVAAACGAELPAADVLALADVAERHAHGTPSGLDAAAVAAAGPILFDRAHGARPVHPAFPPALVVAATGVPRDTHAAVAAVRARREADPAATDARIDALGQAARDAADALAAGDQAQLGDLMDRAHADLVALGVSHPALDALVAAARGAGALGAKLTGAGHGGCVVALARTDEAARAIARALLTQGAARAWTREGEIVMGGPA